MGTVKSVLSDELTGALIGLARCTFQHMKTERTDLIVAGGLQLSAGSSEAELAEMIRQVRNEKELVAPGCSICAARCGNTDDYDMNRLWTADEEIRSLKTVLLLGLSRIASEVYPCLGTGQADDIMVFIYKTLFIAAEDWSREELLSSVTELGNIYQLCRNLPDYTGQQPGSMVCLTAES